MNESCHKCTFKCKTKEGYACVLLYTKTGNAIRCDSINFCGLFQSSEERMNRYTEKTQKDLFS